MNEKSTRRRRQQPPRDAARSSISLVDRQIGEQAATIFYRKTTKRPDVRSLLEKLAA